MVPTSEPQSSRAPDVADPPVAARARALFDTLRASAELGPDRVWLVDGDAALTYRDGLRLVHRLAAGLRSLGVRHGDRVAVCLTASLAIPLVRYAAWMIGAVTVDLDPREPWLAAQIADSRPRVLVFPEVGAPALAAALAATVPNRLALVAVGQGARAFRGAEHPPRRARWLSDLLDRGAALPAPIDPARDLAVLAYGSGSGPRAMTHAELSMNLRREAARAGPHGPNLTATLLATYLGAQLTIRPAQVRRETPCA